MINDIDKIKITKYFTLTKILDKNEYDINIINKVLSDNSEQELKIAQILSDDIIHDKFILIDDTFIVFWFDIDIACISNHGIICGFEFENNSCIPLLSENLYGEKDAFKKNLVIKEEFPNEEIFLLNPLVQNGLVVLGYDENKNYTAFGHSPSKTNKVITDSGHYYIGGNDDIIFTKK